VTKAATKSQRRRRAKSRTISLPGGESVPSPRNGIPRVHATPKDDTPPPIIEARRRMGSASPEDTLNESDMGRCILALSTGDGLRTLRDAWGAISAARQNFKTRCMSNPGNPQSAAAPILSQAMETDPSLRVDLRTPGERDEAAARTWKAWQAAIDALPVPALRWALRGALDGFMGEGRLWRDGRPTDTGKAAVAALRMAADLRNGTRG
jgi:hypothetical protein